MKSNSLAISDFVVTRDGAPLTSPITITLTGGEMLVVRGSNGSGKSTFLKTIAGLLPIARGTILLNGEPASNQPLLYLGHKRGLTLEMTVYDNVAIWAKLSQCPELIPAALRYFELSDIADVPLSKLSAGWQQRVALSRLITIQSSTWLLDEPAANLDTEGTQLLQALVQARLEQGGIIVLATHTTIAGYSIKTLNINTINNKHEVIM